MILILSWTTCWANSRLSGHFGCLNATVMSMSLYKLHGDSHYTCLLGINIVILMTWCPFSARASATVTHRNENVVILTKFSFLAKLKVVILITSSPASDENFIKMKIYSFQCDGLRWPLWHQDDTWYMMTSSNGNIFRVNGHLCGEFTGPRWIPRTKASNAELWCFLWSASE